VPTDRGFPVPEQDVRAYTEAALKTIEPLTGYGHVQFVIFYGSGKENRMTGESDVDLCVY
jgi:predicted nucleotidyltransferase